jgi:hypothetical protein
MESNHRRRVLAAVTGVALGVGAVTVACTHGPPPHHPPPSHPRTTATTATTATSSDTLDCGTINYASGWPTTLRVTLDQGPGQCFLDAWYGGTRARLVTREQTDGQGGHPIVTTLEALGPENLRVTTDSDGAVDPRPLLVQECRQLARIDPRLVPKDCSPLPPAAPPFEGRFCGTIAYASGWPTTLVVNIETGAGRCLLDAWAAGTPARLVTRDQTDGRGDHILIRIYDVLGTGQLRVVTDPRQTVDGGDVTVERCTGLTHSSTRLQPEGCAPA